MFEQKVSPPQVARRLRISRKSPYAWHARWREGGVAAWRSKGPSGRPSRMRPGWRDWLAAELEKGPAAHGWAEVQRWTLDRIATVIARRFHVRSSPAQAWRIPRQMGWTVQVRSGGRPSGTRRRWPRGSKRRGRGGKTVRDHDAWLCFADVSGQLLAQPGHRCR